MSQWVMPLAVFVCVLLPKTVAQTVINAAETNAACLPEFTWVC